VLNEYIVDIMWNVDSVRISLYPGIHLQKSKKIINTNASLTDILAEIRTA
jgi:hypothetical protein